MVAVANDASGWGVRADSGQFSLAGSQAKLALHRGPGGWAVPTGALPPTHIIKPAIATLPDQDLNEHLTTRTASLVGLRVPAASVVDFAGQRALVVERYDRARIGGVDAHAKNYSLLLVLTGFRQAGFHAVPVELKTAISVGIGLFIALIGLFDSGFVTKGVGTPLQLGRTGSLCGWPIVIFVFGLFLMIVLMTRKVRGAILISIISATVLAVVLEAVVKISPRGEHNPDGWSLRPPQVRGGLAL